MLKKRGIRKGMFSISLQRKKKSKSLYMPLTSTKIMRVVERVRFPKHYQEGMIISLSKKRLKSKETLRNY